jgi:hypothetical protein
MHPCTVYAAGDCFTDVVYAPSLYALHDDPAQELAAFLGQHLTMLNMRPGNKAPSHVQPHGCEKNGSKRILNSK